MAWREVSLDSVCVKIQDGAHHSPQHLYAEGGAGRFPYITSKNIRNDWIDLEKLEYADEAFHQSIYPRCNPELGDVLLTKDGANTGNVAINTLDEPFSMLSSVCLLKPDPTRLLSRWLMYYIQSDEGYAKITGSMTGAAIKRIILKTIKTSQIPLPPLSEQKRIVAILDGAFEGIRIATANAEKNFANARELFDRALNDHFDAPDGESAQLAQVCAIVSPLVDPRDEAYCDLPHIGAGNIESKTGRLQDIFTAREEGLKSGKFPFDETMVLYSKIRPYLEKVARPDFSGVCSADMYPLLPKASALNRDYLYYVLLSSRFTQYAVLGSARAGMPKVNREHLFAYEFELPPLDRQMQAVALFDELSIATDRLFNAQRVKLKSLVDLKQAILSRAFSGQLTATKGLAA
jgi:type I restriction enzyme S subunit